jgi:hypothetical protein
MSSNVSKPNTPANKKSGKFCINDTTLNAIQKMLSSNTTVKANNKSQAPAGSPPATTAEPVVTGEEAKPVVPEGTSVVPEGTSEGGKRRTKRRRMNRHTKRTKKTRRHRTKKTRRHRR